MATQSRVLAWAQRYLDGYDNYTAMNRKEEALDMLMEEATGKLHSGIWYYSENGL